MRYCLAKLRENAKEESLQHKMKLLKVAVVLQTLKLKAKAKQVKSLDTLNSILAGQRHNQSVRQAKLARLFSNLLDRNDAKTRLAINNLQENWLKKSFERKTEIRQNSKSFKPTGKFIPIQTGSFP